MLIDGREYEQAQSGRVTLRGLWELRTETARLGDPIGSRRFVELERAVQRAQDALRAARRAGDQDAEDEAMGRLIEASDELMPAMVFLTRRAAGDKGGFLELIDCQVEFVREPGDPDDLTDPAPAGEPVDPTTGPGSPAIAAAGRGPAARKKKPAKRAASSSRTSTT